MGDFDIEGSDTKNCLCGVGRKRDVRGFDNIKEIIGGLD